MAAVPDDDFNPENPSEPAAIDYCRVIVSADPQEGADVSGTGRYEAKGQSIYISTNARNDANYTYKFLYWTLNGNKTSYAQSFYFTATKGRFEFTAHYEKTDTPFEPENPAEPSASNVKRKYFLYLTSNIEGACSFSMPSGTKVPEQSQQYVTVYPNQDYRFDGWKLNGVLVSTDRYYYFTMPSTNTTLEACFTEIPFDPDNPLEPASQGGEIDNTTRKLINLSIGTASDNVDKTRIAINETKTVGYDAGTDATKFISNDADFQIYSLDAQNVKYSVNERPKGDGIIPLGVVIKKAGIVVIKATRLDCTAFLADKVTGNWIDLSIGSCTFKSEAGTFDDRFYIKLGSIEGIPQIIIDNKTREYGDENPEWTYTVEGAELTGKPALSSMADKKSPVGTYPIVATKGSIEGDYSVVEGTLTVTKAPLKISAGTYTIKRGDAIPEFILTFEGFKNDETKDVLTIQPTVTCTATANSTPGNYAITLSDAEAKNYEISYVAGQLTIIERPTFTLTYMVDGAVYKTVSIKESATIIPEAAPTKEGYTFSGWSEIPKTMPDHDVTITGTFAINKYKLVYKVDGAEYKSYEIEYGATITAETAPTMEGYTFSGWSEIPETMPANDVTVTGTFSINSYKLTYMIDNEVYKEVTYEYGATITPEPTPEGNYTSFEWVDLPETMPAHDVQIHARYEVTGIDEIMMSQSSKRIYSPNGKQLDNLQKGLNIIKMEDGSTRKIIKK